MKLAMRILATFFLGVTLVFPVVVTASAATDPLANVCTATDSSGAKSSVCDKQTTDPLSGTDGIIVKGARLIALITGIAAVIIIIIAGIKYVLSSGDSAKINNAKNTIIYALIGLVIAVIAPSIISFILRSIK